MKIYISHSSNYDYLNELYLPLKKSKICKNNEVFFPHDKEPINTKSVIGSFDLIIADVSFPTTGQGIELGWASYCDVPILCIYKNGAKISSSLKFIAKEFIEYTNTTDMTQQVESFIERNKLTISKSLKNKLPSQK